MLGYFVSPDRDASNPPGFGGGISGSDDEFDGPNFLFAPAYSEGWGVLFDVEVSHDVCEFG